MFFFLFFFFSVQLWVVGNYHWYLKQNLNFGNNDDNKVVSVAWDPEISYRLHVVCVGWQYFQYDWCWSTDRSSGQSPGSQADVTVIDGGKIVAIFIFLLITVLGFLNRKICTFWVWKKRWAKFFFICISCSPPLTYCSSPFKENNPFPHLYCSVLFPFFFTHEYIHFAKAFFFFYF